MTDDEWLGRMTEELRRRGVAEEAVAEAVAEAGSHLDGTGNAAVVALGMPGPYAAAVAGSLVGYVPRGRPEPGVPRVQVVGVGKRYGRRQVLRDVSLTVRAGEVAAVVGANGSGKSTFLGICAGLVSADEGRVVVDGSIGFCPQYGGTLDHLHPDEHFALVGAGRGTPRREAHRLGRELAATLQWNAATRTQARHLSGGTRQKLNLTLAALGDPDVLLLDEPYQGFDQGSYLDFWEQVWQWRDRGTAVVVVTHLLEQLDRVDVVLDLPNEVPAW